MKITDLKGKKITVMGLGLQGGGVGTVRFLAEAGAQVRVTDLKSKQELAASLEKLKGLKNISYIFQQHRLEDFTQVDMVVKNPSVSWKNKHIILALEKKIPVEVDSSLFFKLCRNKIIGVTGTKGKTTTASFVYSLLKTAGKNPIKVGVSRVSVLDKLKELKKDSIVVFELSSWRLSALGKYKFSPRIAVITNIYPDHLNYYSSMEKYIQDKKYIFLYQKKEDICVINQDNIILKEWEKEIIAQQIKFSQEEILLTNAVYIKDGIIYSRNSNQEEKVIEVKEIKLKGVHNLSNVLAAVSVAKSLNIKTSLIKKGILNLKNIAHRLEFVRELAGVQYYNDTTATTPEAAIQGVKAFSAPIILICGGADKKLDLDQLGKIIYEQVKGVVFLEGKATDKIVSAIKKIDKSLKTKKFNVVKSMEKAVELAQSTASEGDVILLSPGAASFGLFANEFERGKKFKEVVRELK